MCEDTRVPVVDYYCDIFKDIQIIGDQRNPCLFSLKDYMSKESSHYDYCTGKLARADVKWEKDTEEVSKMVVLFSCGKPIAYAMMDGRFCCLDTTSEPDPDNAILKAHNSNLEAFAEVVLEKESTDEPWTVDFLIKNFGVQSADLEAAAKAVQFKRYPIITVSRLNKMIRDRCSDYQSEYAIPKVNAETFNFEYIPPKGEPVIIYKADSLREIYKKLLRKSWITLPQVEAYRQQPSRKEQ